MKQGQLINGYTIVSRPTNANAGKCVWAFATKAGRHYFIKEYLDPKLPRTDSMGTPADKRRRYRECQRFEQRHRRMASLLRADQLHAGNLVLVRDFFAAGTRYYKVTDRIEAVDVVPHRLPEWQQLVILRTLGDSLRLLHSHGIVHGDLKPENVLLSRPPRSDLCTAKLIDFDDAYPVGDPPAPDELGGNPIFAAPEWLSYLHGEAGQSAMGQAVDMFAFGLLMHVYLYGAGPGHDDRYDSPASAVLDEAPLCWDARVPDRLGRLMAALTRRDPAVRPDIASVMNALDDPALLRGDTPPRSRVRVNLTGGR
ncbi:MAG: protein kinase [Mycobacterium sp.]|nr:protein kinase [Mycobacterium sp.]